MSISNGTLKKVCLLRKVFVGSALTFFPITASLVIWNGALSNKAYKIIDEELEYPKYKAVQTSDLNNKLENGEIDSEEYKVAFNKINDKKAFLKEYGSEEQIQRFDEQLKKCSPLFYASIVSLSLFAFSGFAACITGAMEICYDDKLKKTDENLLDENTPL